MNSDISKFDVLPNLIFNSAKINFTLKKSGSISIILYSLIGEKAAAILDEFKAAGDYSVPININVLCGSELPTGDYIIFIKSESVIVSRKILVVK